MRIFLALGVAAAGLALALPAPALAQQTKPAFVVRVNALDDLIADLQELARLGGREDEFKQVEGLLKSKTGPKGLEGIDTKKPIGLYGTVKAKIDESQGVLLLPIADEKTFLKFLETLDLKPEKGKGGIYALNVEQIPFPVIFRFENGYLYGTVKVSEKQEAALTAKALPEPAGVLAAGAGSLLAVTANLDEIPKQLKNLGETSLALALSSARDMAQPGETPASKKLREATVDEFGEVAKALLQDATATTLRVDHDRKGKELSLTFDLQAQAGSKLARDLASLQAKSSVGAGLLTPGAMVSGSLHLALPERLREPFAGAVEEGFKKSLEAEKDKGKRERSAPFLEALTPTIRAGLADLAFTISPPDADGKITLLVGGAVKDGSALEKSVKQALAKAPADDQKMLKLDVARAGKANVHQIEPTLDAQGKESFGDGPVYFAVRDDALLLTMGPKALSVIKESAGKEPLSGAPMTVEMAVKRMVPLIAKSQKKAPEVAKKAFTEEGSDVVRASVDASRGLRVRVSLKTAVIGFASLMDKANKGE